MKKVIICIFMVVIVTTISGCDFKQSVITNNSPNEYMVGDVIELENGLSSGLLKVTITDSTLISDASELPNEEMFFEQYRRYVTDDRTFVDGSYLIVIDIDIESVAAKARLSLTHDDPYMFRIDSLFTLVDISEKQGQNYRYQTVDYFSLLNAQDTHPLAFELEPEESISFRIGFFTGKKKDGSRRELSNLFLCTSSGNPESDFIALNLEASEDD